MLRNWKVLIGLLLVSLSALVYFIHYLIFRDSHHIFIYLVGDIAFLPLEVLLVTLIIERLLKEREKQAIFRKLDMLIGAFYSELGKEVLGRISQFSGNRDELMDRLRISNNWKDKDFAAAMQFVERWDPKVDSRKGDLSGLRDFLSGKRDFMVSLLANPNLFEHESFTDLLWAVFHFTEELAARERLTDLPAKDYEHLSGDIDRVYCRLLKGWISYMEHLKEDYPYLFSLAVRTNPYNIDASPIVT